MLTISGERKEERREGSEEGGNLRVERSFGSFMRRFRLPDNVDVEGGCGWGAVAAGTGRQTIGSRGAGRQRHAQV